MNNLIWTGFKAPLQLEQVPKQPRYVFVPYVVGKFMGNWRSRVNKIGKTFLKSDPTNKDKKIRIWSVLLATYGVRLLVIFVVG